MLFHVTIEKAEDGWFVVECPSLPGCVSQGKDEQEALANISGKETIKVSLQSRMASAGSGRQPRGDGKARRENKFVGSSTSRTINWNSSRVDSPFRLDRG